MTAWLGPRLAALLSDLGMAHPADPAPVPREIAAGGSWDVPRDTKPFTVVLVVEGADVDALAAAGLHLIRGTEPVLSGTILPASVLAVADVPGVVSLDLDQMSRLELHTSVPATHADHVRTGALGLNGAGVVIGVVDTGIDIYHQAFRKANGDTRLLALRDLTSPYTITASGAPTAGNFQLQWIPPSGQAATLAPHTTPNLAFNATVQQVLAALNGLRGVTPGDILATGGPLPGAPIVVSFAGRYLNKDVEPLVVSTTSVTPAPAAIVISRGRDYTPTQINHALQNAGEPFLSFDAVGHGTHVMGIAGGDGSQAGNCQGSDYYIGVAPGADLIAVKTTLRQSDNILGVQYVFAQAAAKAAVVNCSFGGEISAHDGSEADEVAFDAALAATTGRAIIVSAGNDGALYDHTRPNEMPSSGGGLHSFKTVQHNNHETMDIVIRPNDKKDDWFVIGYAGAGRVSLVITEPGGTQSGVIAPTAFNGLAYTTPLAGHGLQVTNYTSVPPGGRHAITVLLRPPAGGSITSGTWKFTLTETAGTTTDVDCWISLDRSDPHPRFSNADQDRTRTLTHPATARNVITVASYDPRTNLLAGSSSRGPTVDTRLVGETKPDITAPGEGITSALSQARNTGICCDCCTDFYVTMSGTSMAAPHITGIVALLFQRNHSLTFDQVRAHLRAAADPPDPITGPTLPNFDWGAGIVNAEAAAAAIPALAATTDSPTALPSAPVPLAGAPSPVRVPALVPSVAAMLGDGIGAPRLRELRRAASATPAGQLAAALVSTHLDEVLRLVNTDRRCTVAWHRMRGPDLIQHLLRTPADDPLLLPSELHGQLLVDGCARLLDELERAGSLGLRADIARHRALLLSLPGLPLADLRRLSWAG